MRKLLLIFTLIFMVTSCDDNMSYKQEMSDTQLIEAIISDPNKFEIEEADVESSLGDWSVGFVDAMFLNEDAWFAPEYEEQLIDLTLPMMVFSGIDEEDPQMESFRRNGQLMDELAEEIPDNLNELYLMYHTPN